VDFVQFDAAAATPDQIHARWTDILRSLPNVRRLRVSHRSLAPLMAVLHLHLPLLEQLALRSWDGESPDALLTQFAHPSVRQIELSTVVVTQSKEQVRALNQAWVHSVRLPNLARIICDSRF
jgi:acyl carrier protein phosphodiesterase